ALVGRAHFDHRLDRDHQPRLQAKVHLAQFAVAAHHEIRHLRVLVHDAADAVADVLLDDAVARVLDVPLHQPGDLGPPAFLGDLVHGDFQDLLAGLDQPAALGADIADRNADGGVGAPAVELAGGVDLDDVAV